MAKLLGKLLQSEAAKSAAATLPGGGIALKVINIASGILGKTIQRKKSKAEEKKKSAELKIAQLNALEQKALVNRGTDTPDSPAQAATFGTLPTEKKGLYMPSGGEGADFEKIKSETMEDKMNFMDTLKKYWYYFAAGVVVLFLVFKKRRR